MAIDLRLLVFVNHPTAVFSLLACALAFAAVGPISSLWPTVLLLATLQLYTQIFIHRHDAKKRGFLLWFALSFGSALAYWAPSRDALSTPSSSLGYLSVIAAVLSLFGFLTVVLSTFIGSRIEPAWPKLLLFPSLFAIVMGASAAISPVGHLLSWSPVEGLGSYAWLRPIAGQYGIDWVAAAWSVLLAEAIGTWYVGVAPEDIIAEQPNIIDFNHDYGVDSNGLVANGHPGNQQPHGALAPTATSPRSRTMLSVGALLILLTFPSFFITSSPLPQFTQHSTPFSVGCVLPQTKSGDPPGLGDYISEMKKLTWARILLWPESALRFDNATQRELAVKTVANFTAQFKVYAGMTFEDTPPAQDGMSGKRRNGLLLVGPDGPVFEYYKRHLVPIAESFSIAPSNDDPTIYTLPLKAPNKMNKTDWAPAPNFTRPIPLSASICLDFAHPSALAPLQSRPALVLAPARTWHPSVGRAMWTQALARADEIGSAVLWCDGGKGGVSGVAGGGYAEPVQVGAGSWVKTVGVQWHFKDQRTLYAWGGAGLGTALAVLPMGLGSAVTAMALGTGSLAFIVRLRRRVQEWRDARRRGGVGETTRLLM